MNSRDATAGYGDAVRINTRRTILRSGSADDAEAIVSFYRENQEHLQPFDPVRPPHFYQPEFWRRQMQERDARPGSGGSFRLFVCPKAEPERIIGNIGFSNFVRGVGQYCTVGYSIGKEFEGEGIMHEALSAGIQYVFDTLNLHRIEANYMPHNVRSARLLKRLGFVVEGYSRDYLRIGGKWEDHVRSALLNPDWRDEQ